MINRSNIETLDPEWIEKYKENWGKRECEGYMWT